MVYREAFVDGQSARLIGGCIATFLHKEVGGWSAFNFTRKTKRVLKIHMKTIKLNGERQKGILIFDAHPLLRAGLTATLGAHSDFEVCGEVANLEDAIRWIGEQTPDLLILGISNSSSHFLELLKDIRVHFPGLIMVISMYDEFLYARRAIMAGANGFLSLREPLAVIIKAIERLFAGEIYISRHAMSRIASQLVGRKHVDNDHSLNNLTDRELQVFELTGKGLGVREIAGHLNLSKSTVETYRNRIKDKLGIKDSSELLQSAIDWKCNGHLGWRPAGKDKARVGVNLFL